MNQQTSTKARREAARRDVMDATIADTTAGVVSLHSLKSNIDDDVAF